MTDRELLELAAKACGGFNLWGDEMNKEEIMRMARESGFDAHDMSDDFTCNLADIERFFRAAHAAGAAAEREACAKVCEEPGWNAANWCAKAIRARGKS